MPTTVIAQVGDSLCSIAIANGFKDCKPLRDDPANASIVNNADHPGQVQVGDVVTVPDITTNELDKPNEQLHKFKRKGVPLGEVRFVHGSPTKHFADDDTITRLNVSNMQTDQVGAGDGATTITAAQHFDAQADADPDTFKVEVHQPKGSGTLKVQLDALRPVFTGGVLTGHQFFPGDRDDATTEAGKRSLNLDCSKQGGSDRWRSSYLRLVVDDLDKAALPAQTLLTTDMTDEGDDTVEILDQVVQASFVFTTCPGTPDKAKCRSTVQIPIGDDRKRVKMQLTILNATPGGAPVVNAANVVRRINRWFRRGYAQANVTHKFVGAVKTVDPVGNLVSISNDTGARAAGDGQLGFRLSVAGQPPVTIGPITPTANADPTTTANALAALVVAPFTATVFTNPPTFSTAIGSADILITAAGNARVTIDTPLTGDSKQSLTIGIINPAALNSWTGDNFLVGSLDQRVVCRNYDTGDDRVDMFIVQTLANTTNNGEAMMSGHTVNAAKRAGPQVKCSFFGDSSFGNAGDQFPFGIPHEVGHVITDLIHPAQAADHRQLMNHFLSPTHAVNGHKRIRDANIQFDGPAGNFNQIARIRSEDAQMGLLEDF
jgi:hypothetical protein